MDLLYLVDRLEEQIAGAQRMPIGNRSIVDRRRLLDIVDQMRVAIPGEVHEARELLQDQESVKRDAEEQARLLLAQSEERAARLVDDGELVHAARERAADIERQAEVRAGERLAAANADVERRLDESRRLADEQTAAADAYARELLGRLADQIGAFQDSVRAGLVQLEATAGEPAPPGERAAARTDAILAAALGPGADAGGAAIGSAPAPAPDRGPARSLFGSLLSRPAPDAAADPEAQAREAPPRLLPPDEPEPLPSAGPGVIDDFAMPALDDQPAPGPAADGRSGGAPGF